MLRYVCFSLLLCHLSFSRLQAQEIILSFDFKKNKVIINETIFDEKSTLESYKKVLGEPIRIERTGGVERIYAYDSIGVSLSVKANTSIIDGVVITYQYDGDKKVAKGIFKGKIIINGNEINEKHSALEINKITGLELKGFMGLYTTKPNRMVLSVYYPDEKSTAIGQFLIAFGQQ